MKTCRKCGEQFEISSGFYRHEQMADGYLNICKACTRSRVLAHRNLHVESIRQYDRQRGRAGHGHDAARRWAEKYPEKRRAQNAVYSAIKKGVIVRGDCWCGERGEAHHPDYSKPLDVVWLCKLHHEKLHAMIA